MTNDQPPLTITDAAGFVRRGELTPVELLEQCLARVDRYEDRVRAWVYLDREGAREQAERLTAELKAGQNRGPLHGIPVGIKDIIDVFDMPTGCGSKLWANSYARRDATVVQRLRQAGAVIMGKTVTTAYASFDPPVTRNPWNLDRTPGGSSSGSAAAVACGMCLGALATQTGGSITRPASYCGVCSIKPSYGRVSVDGVLPLAPSMDHVGCMANCVRDLAILLQPLAKLRNRHFPDIDYYLWKIEGNEPSPRSELSALPNFPASASSEMDTAFQNLREKALGGVWTWLARPLPPLFSHVQQDHRTIMAVEAAAYHLERLRRHPDDYPPRIRELIEHGRRSAAPDMAKVWDRLWEFREETEEVFLQRHGVFITPAAPGEAPAADTTGDPAFNSPWSYAGLPTVSLPFAWSKDSLPLSAQLIGQRWCEDDLLAVAARLEKDIGFEWRAVPL